jgi:hypothetical protein
MNVIHKRQGLAETADEIAQGLGTASVMGDRAFIRTPILFPSGTSVVVVLRKDRNGRFRLSDLGQGHEEARDLGITETFLAQATEVASRGGIGFDGHAFAVADLSKDQLVGATIAIANASSRALERALERADIRPADAAVAGFAGRLGQLFPAATIAREWEVRGESTHVWQVDVLFETPGRRAIFDFVSGHPASIALSACKFADIARLDDPPARFAVTRCKADIGDLLPVIGQSASVIQDDIGDAALQRVVFA